jgi:hypothetical protein
VSTVSGMKIATMVAIDRFKVLRSADEFTKVYQSAID